MCRRITCRRGERWGEHKRASPVKPVSGPRCEWRCRVLPTSPSAITAARDCASVIHLASPHPIEVSAKKSCCLSGVNNGAWMKSSNRFPSIVYRVMSGFPRKPSIIWKMPIPQNMHHCFGIGFAYCHLRLKIISLISAGTTGGGNTPSTRGKLVSVIISRKSGRFTLAVSSLKRGTFCRAFSFLFCMKYYSYCLTSHW